MGKQWKQCQTLFWGAQNHCRWWFAAMKLKDVYSLEGKLRLTSTAYSKAETLSTKVRLVKAMVFPVVMYGCESWTIKKVEHWRIDSFELWCWTRLLKSPWDGKEIKLVNPKGNHSWIFIGRTDVKAKTPILWPPDAKNWLTRKDPDAGKDWRQEKGMTEDEMVGRHHQFNGHEFEQALEIDDDR